MEKVAYLGNFLYLCTPKNKRMEPQCIVNRLSLVLAWIVSSFMLFAEESPVSEDSTALLSSSLIESSARFSFENILRDITETMLEQDQSVDVEAIEEQLYALVADPINLNTTTTEELERLMFLSPEQIDAILLYGYEHPFHTVHELQLIHCLSDYEVRNLLPFVYVGAAEMFTGPTMRDMMLNSHHELNMRLDVRNPENYHGDPVYSSIKYKMRATRHLQIGATVVRTPGEHFREKSRYGGYIQLKELRGLKTVVVGDYRASFGLGLVMNSQLPLGKSSITSTMGIRQQGLRGYNGASSDFMRGVGLTTQWSDCQLSAFYSYRLPDSLYRQTAGLNFNYRKNRFCIGLTAVEYWTPQPLSYRPNYYNGNYFHDQNQFSASVSAQYAFSRTSVFGEMATSQNSRWGMAALVGVRYVPVQDIRLMGLIRYYSPTYDAVYGSAFGETSRPNDEHGIYLGADILRWRRWRLSMYSDFFAFMDPKYMIRGRSWGYDVVTKVSFSSSKLVDMYARWRMKQKGENLTNYVRYHLSVNLSNWTFQTQLDASLLHKHSSVIESPTSIESPSSAVSRSTRPTWGTSVFTQVEYHSSAIPLTAHVRLDAFYIPHYDNRIYTYENDVLYAFSIPALYGIGLRYFLNMRYRIGDHYSLYLKASDTWYSPQWVEQQHLKSAHKTDIHLLLRITY